MAEATERYAVVTGANKGIGLEIVRQLASAGIKVVLTARDEKRGLEALETLKASGLSDLVLFHQVDVADAPSVASLADFVKSQFGKLDILVNNAGIGGTVIKDSDFISLAITSRGALSEDDTRKAMIQTYELAEECLKINYYGAKITSESLLPLLQLSDSPRIVNVSASMGKLEVNNAGIGGVVINDNDLFTSEIINPGVLSEDDARKAMTRTYELAEECLKINYYGAKITAESLQPLLQLSDSPRIVNVSSLRGKLECVSNEWAKGVFGDADNLTEERVDEVLKEFLKDFKEGSLESKGWPRTLGAYTVSKAAMNAYTRILAKKHPTFFINAVCPGYVKTDITNNTGILTVEEGAASPVRLALLSNGSPSGLFYSRNEASSF